VATWYIACLIKRFICGCQPLAEEGTALLMKAAGQGHVYAMYALGCMHRARQEHEQAVEWFTKGAEAGLPKAMHNVGCCLDAGEGVSAPDHPAAADWYRRAAVAGSGEAAGNLSNMYTVGRGRAWLLMRATSSSTCRTLVPCTEWHHTKRQALSGGP
jgi:TPR repeat protein